MNDGTKKTGRRSKVEELGLLDEKRALLDAIDRLDLANSEEDCGRLSLMAARGHVEGLLSEPECKSLHRAAAIALKAIAQAKADAEISRLEKLAAEAREKQAKVKQDQAQARTNAH